ncbi:MAG: hypothetical protein C0501_22755 [Isosphaera sp.]|nr:hypothetical protein [Isosphaera sp.]
MAVIRGTIQDGKVVFATPPGWPDGTEVTVTAPAFGADELPDDNDSSPAAITQRLALMDRVQGWMTPEDYAAWERARAEQKAWELANWDARCKKIEDLFK